MVKNIIVKEDEHEKLDLSKLLKLFQEADREGHQYVSLADFKRVVNNFNKQLLDEDFEVMIKQALSDGNEFINYNGERCHFLNTPVLIP